MTERERLADAEQRLADIERLAKVSRDVDIWKLRELMDRICRVAAGRPKDEEARR